MDGRRTVSNGERVQGRPNVPTPSASSTSLSSSFSSAGSTSIMHHADSSQSSIGPPPHRYQLDAPRPVHPPSNGHSIPPSAWSPDGPLSPAASTKRIQLTTAAVNTTVKLKRAFAARRKNKSIDVSPALASTPTASDGRPRNNSVGGIITSHLSRSRNSDREDGPPPSTPSTPKSAKLKLHMAAQALVGARKASQPAPLEEPAPPPLPPKPINPQLVITTKPISSVPTAAPGQNRSSVIPITPGISSAVTFMREEEQKMMLSTMPVLRNIQQPSSKTLEDEDKEGWRKSDSTITHNIRPGAGVTDGPRPVSIAESLQSTHTVVRRRSATLLPEVSAQEEQPSSSSGSSPASSIRVRNRRSMSLNMNMPPIQSVSQPSNHRQPPVTQPAVDAPPSLSSLSLTASQEAPFVTKAAATGILTPSSSSEDSPSINTNIKGRLAGWAPQWAPATSSRPQMTPSSSTSSKGSTSHTGHGLAKRAVEKLGRWGFSSSNASNSSSSSTGHSGPSAYPEHTLAGASSHNNSNERTRRTPDAPSGAWSVSSSSPSDPEASMTPSGPELGLLTRPPLIKMKSGGPGIVFGKDLRNAVGLTAVWANQAGPAERNDHHGQLDVNKDNLAVLESRALPAVAVRCAQHIMIWGVQEEGLFRVSGRPAHVAKVRNEFDSGADYDMQQCSPGELDPHAVASVFKAFLRELPDPILTRSLIPYFEEALSQEANANAQQAQSTRKIGGTGGPGLPSGPKVGIPAGPKAGMPMQQLRKPPSLSTLAMPSFSGTPPPSKPLRKALKSLISQLPVENRDLLRTVTELIKVTAKESRQTKMPLSNLLLVFCPSLNMNPPLLRVLCEAEGIWDTAEPPVMDIKRESSDVLDISTEHSSLSNVADVAQGTDSDEGHKDHEESSVFDDGPENNTPPAAISVGQAEAQAMPRPSVEISEAKDQTPSDGLSRSNSKHLPPTRKPLGPRRSQKRKKTQADAHESDAEIASLHSLVNKEQKDDDDIHEAIPDATDPSISSSSESSSIQDSSGPETPSNQPFPEQDVKPDPENGGTIPQVSLPSPPGDNRNGSIEFPRSSDSAPQTPLSPRRSAPLLSLPPSLKAENATPSSQPVPPSPRSLKRILKPSILFSRRSESSLGSRRSSPSSSGRPIISPPYLHLPAASTSELLPSPPVTSTNLTALGSGAFIIDTPIDSSSLSAGLGLDIPLISPPETGDVIGIQDFPVTPYPPGATPLRSGLLGPAAASPSIDEAPVRSRPLPARQIMNMAGATSSRLELSDTSDTSEWTKSVLMDFDLTHFSSS